MNLLLSGQLWRRQESLTIPAPPKAQKLHPVYTDRNLFAFRRFNLKKKQISRFSILVYLPAKAQLQPILKYDISKRRYQSCVISWSNPGLLPREYSPCAPGSQRAKAPDEGFTSRATIPHATTDQTREQWKLNSGSSSVILPQQKVS